MSDLKLSICIPTYNRARYLETVLVHLQEVVAQLPFETEIIVSDNASDDNTLALLETSQALLPLTILKQSENIGAVPNMHAALRAAKGTYLVYLADDDRLRVEALQNAISMLDANPAASALYAPWQIKDLVTGQVTGQFYRQPRDVSIAQGNYGQLLEHIAEHSIYSEICILRREVFQALNPIANDIAFWAFTTPAEYLGAGDLIYAQEPFYCSISRHFVGDNRAQLGFSEVMTAWDTYRGGLEVLHGLALAHGGLTKPAMVAKFIRNHPIERMYTALKLRLQLGGDPLESYTLAARLRGLGLGSQLPAPMEQIRSTAALYFACVKLPATLRAESVTIIGNCPEETLQQLAGITNLPVRRAQQADGIGARDVVLDFSCQDETLLEAARTSALAHVTDTQLQQKFA
ncbi:glycosyl transferase family 2 [Rhodobacteraceae bacterium (ex Bugula neritina AB1)]|nr:glycosyl transferase family 2 [Rhodobacteraceae bacterium (ex Bugula neritina AB1)]